MSKILFSFKGTLDRGTFLKYSLIVVVLALLTVVIFGATLGGRFMTPGGLVGLVFLWMWLALFVKRGNSLGVWWPWTVLLAVIFAPVTWIFYLVLGKK